MKKFSVIAFVVGMTAMLLAEDVLASTIGKGTISISTSSDMFYLLRKTQDDKEDDYSAFNIDFAGGYFIIDNLELELGAYFTKTKYNDEDESTATGIDPMVRYHFPLSENFNLYLGGGVGFGKYNEDGKNWGQDDSGGWYQYSYELEESRFSILADFGGEFFLNPMIALTIGVGYRRDAWSRDQNGSDLGDLTRDNFYLPVIGLKVLTTRPAND